MNKVLLSGIVVAAIGGLIFFLWSPHISIEEVPAQGGEIQINARYDARPCGVDCDEFVSLDDDTPLQARYQPGIPLVPQASDLLYPGNRFALAGAISEVTRKNYLTGHEEPVYRKILVSRWSVLPPYTTIDAQGRQTQSSQPVESSLQ